MSKEKTIKNTATLQNTASSTNSQHRAGIEISTSPQPIIIVTQAVTKINEVTTNENDKSSASAKSNSRNNSKSL